MEIDPDIARWVETVKANGGVVTEADLKKAADQVREYRRYRIERMHYVPVSDGVASRTPLQITYGPVKITGDVGAPIVLERAKDGTRIWLKCQRSETNDAIDYFDVTVRPCDLTPGTPVELDGKRYLYDGTIKCD